MRLRVVIALLALTLACGALSCERSNPRRPLMIYAAMSLREPISELGQEFSQDTSRPVHFNFAASHVLARQIKAARGADVFVSANVQAMDEVARAGLLTEGTRTEPARNVLVVVANVASKLRVTAPEDLLKARRVAIGDPRGVPAGRYAKRFLESSQAGASTLWQRLTQAGKLAPTAHVRAALAVAEADNNTLAIVYRTDARVSRAVRVVYRVPQADSGAIRYQAAAMTPRGAAGSALAPGAEAGDDGSAFTRFLTGERGQAAFERHGFEVP